MDLSIEELKRMQEINIMDLKREELANVEDIVIPTEKCMEAGLILYRTDKNPFAQNVGEYILQVGFMEWNR